MPTSTRTTKTPRQEVWDILRERDDLDDETIAEIFEEARDDVRLGMDPEEACRLHFGLEPDYIFALL